MESIICAVITGVLALVGVIITNSSSNKKVQTSVEVSQAVTNTKLDELTREVREHNGFARRMPVVEEQINGMLKRLEALEEYHKAP